MFILVPWKVDVPQERWPVMNWLIIVALIAVYALQVADAIEYATNPGVRVQDSPQHSEAASPESSPQESRRIPGITGELLLRDWSLKGLFGHMWLHAGLLHLGGNLMFLWIFGNAVCAKLGNIRYLVLYVLCGVAAGVTQLLFDPGPMLGASGAINGVVGMYLVLFYENEISCLFACVFPMFARTFEVSSIWMILFWLFWDVVGALRGGSGVGYFAHLGGFATGFAIVMFMCYRGWITMERYEESLLDAWRKRRDRGKSTALDPTYSYLAREARSEPSPDPAPAPPADPKPIPLPDFVPHRTSIRTVCTCGRDIVVPQQYAGKTIRCSACKQPLVIPATTDFFGPSARPHKTVPPLQTEPRNHLIRFACSCGKKLKAPAQHAGRFGKCPQCGSRVKIPTIST
ncbi:MAG: rhomboid family intramembrane serine protease [Solirubrobacterales bacterium]